MYDEIQEVEALVKEVEEGKPKTQDDISMLYAEIKPRIKQEVKLMDSLSFSQLTPPPMQRKFGQNANLRRENEKTKVNC